MKSTVIYIVSFITSITMLGCGIEQNATPTKNTEIMSGPPAESNGSIIFTAARNTYAIEYTNLGTRVKDLVGYDGTVDVSNANILIFSDARVNLGLSKLSKSISDVQMQKLVELYIAFFNRLPDADGMAYWIAQVRDGKTMVEVAENFYAAGVSLPELTGYTKTMTYSDFVKVIYKNVLGRSGTTAPNEAEVQYWVDDLTSGRQTKSSLINTMIYSARTFASDPNFGWVAQLLDNKVKIGKHLAIEQGISFLSDAENIQKNSHLARLITPTSTDAAILAFGMNDPNFNLLASVPGAPSNLITTPSDNGGAISFIASNDQGGLPILSYQLNCTDGITTIKGIGSGSPIIVNGLENSRTYTCQIFASNAFGMSVGSLGAKLTPVSSTNLGNFNGNIVLGSPSDTSIKASVFSSSQSGKIQIRYGTTPGVYSVQTEQKELVANQASELTLTGLKPDTRYYYRLDYIAANGVGSGPSIEYSFQSARSPGQSFTFALQGDSHPERERSQFDSALYTRTLETAANDRPDFYLLMGDDFSVDTLDPKTINAAKVRERYTIQRPYLGIIGARSPVFLVNGNHEQAARFNLNGTPENIGVWAQNSRNSLYSQPAPDAFYSGNKELVPFIGLLRNYYAWTWGDALFVVIDPYWSSPVAVDNVFGGEPKRTNMWDVTHGDEQYMWLKETLENSKAKYKFVFAHHVMGTGRGGVELAGSWEWGGKNSKGVNEFATQRPRWNVPIHQLMVANKVTIFFQGHDHIWVHQQLDGITYQSLSEPADPNYALWNSDAYLTGERFPSTGYTRVNVAPTGVKVEYVRTYLPKDEGTGKTNGVPVFSYTISNPQ